MLGRCNNHYFVLMNPSMFVPLRIIVKKFLQLSMWRSVREAIEAPLFGEFLCRIHEAQRANGVRAPRWDVVSSARNARRDQQTGV